MPLGRATGKGRVPSPCSRLAVSYGPSPTATGQCGGIHGATSQLPNAQWKAGFRAGREKRDLRRRDPRSSTQRGRLLLWTRPRRRPVWAQSLTVSPFPWVANQPRRLGRQFSAGSSTLILEFLFPASPYTRLLPAQRVEQPCRLVNAWRSACHERAKRILICTIKKTCPHTEAA